MREADHQPSKHQPPRAKARWYREFVRSGTIAACLGLALLVSGCDTTDSQYFRYGIGTDLYTADIAETTAYQEIYLTELCRQALPSLMTTESECLGGAIGQNEWGLIVQAGLNDVDRRCDSYLAWLDDRRRTNNAVLKELGDVTVASQAIMRVAGVSANPITLAGLAFGLATNTFTNINSRLILEIDKTTVQTLVLRRRNDFRLQLRDVNIVSRPAVVHALRSYLSICTPFTIETDINATITVFQETGAAGIDRKGPLVTPVTAGMPAKPRDQFAGRNQPAGQIQIVPGAEMIISGYPANANIYTPKDIGVLLTALCAPATDLKQIGPVTQALLDVWQHTDTRNASSDGKIHDRQRQALKALQPCPNGILNAFERQTFSNSDGTMKPLNLLIDLLNSAPPAATGSQNLAATASLQDARPRVAQLRRDCFSSLTQLPSTMTNQVTQDFLIALKGYAENARNAQAAGQPIPHC